jgi:hypothetical protein
MWDKDEPQLFPALKCSPDWKAELDLPWGLKRQRLKVLSSSGIATWLSCPAFLPNSTSTPQNLLHPPPKTLIPRTLMASPSPPAGLLRGSRMKPSHFLPKLGAPKSRATPTLFSVCPIDPGLLNTHAASGFLTMSLIVRVQDMSDWPLQLQVP